MSIPVRSQRALATTMHEMARLSGGRARDDGGVVLFDGAAPGLGLWAGVVRTDPSVQAPTVLERADAFFAGSPRRYTVMTSGSLDGDLEAHLASAGHQPISDGPEMWIDAPIAGQEAVPGVRLETVADEDGRRAFLEVAGRSFVQLGEDPSSWPLAYPDVDSLAGDDRVAMVVSADGVPVACGMAYVAGDVAHVIHIGTDPQHQGQGHGTRITAMLTNRAFDRGADLVTLIATPPGEPVYRRLGYTEAGRGRWWLLDPGRS